MDHLSVSDKNYDKKYNDMQERLDKLYAEITDIENAMEEVLYTIIFHLDLSIYLLIENYLKKALIMYLSLQLIFIKNIWFLFKI